MLLAMLLALAGCQSSIFGDDCLRNKTLAQENYRPTPDSTQQNRNQEGIKQVAEPLAIAEPQYPRNAYQCGIEGWVQFEVTVKTDGYVKDINILDSSPDRTFVQEARKAVNKWRFKPAKNDKDEWVESTFIFAIEFKLPDPLQ